MTKSIKDFVATCDIFQHMKSKNLKQQGLLVPLLILAIVWANILMDSILHLPTRRDKLVIIFLIDQLTKFYHFGALLTNYTTTRVDELFIAMVIKLHSIPNTIVSDRDRVFTGKF